MGGSCRIEATKDSIALILQGTALLGIHFCCVRMRTPVRRQAAQAARHMIISHSPVLPRSLGVVLDDSR